ncbi:MAG: N-acyl homoserine lactonase family protein [Pseudomonadota bacterium]|nr:N-acyl homoserine lactonase family protein [Pseudomonadota bacterium]
MIAEIYAFECGQLTMPLAIFFENADDGTMRAPIPSFLIKHPKGTVLFDTGLNEVIKTDPVGYMGERLAGITEVHFSDGEEIASRLETVDIDIERIDFVVNSHLHFDHCGCNDKVVNAPVIIQKREWDWATKPEPDGGYVRSDYDTGQDMKIIEGEYDLFGDGSVVCIPTYGHTPGHQSLKIQTAKGEYVLTGDACYLRKTLEELALPGVMHDREQTIASLNKFRELQARGAQIIYGHDPEFWPSLPKGPERVA